MNTLGEHVINCATENGMENELDSNAELVISINGPDLETLNEKVQYFIKHKFSRAAQRHSLRGRPSFTETQDAIAALLETDPTLEVADENATAAEILEELAPSAVS